MQGTRGDGQFSHKPLRDRKQTSHFKAFRQKREKELGAAWFGGKSRKLRARQLDVNLATGFSELMLLK